MSNVWNRNGGITKGKKQVTWTTQENTMKRNERLSFVGIVGEGEDKLSPDVKAEVE